jgi:hypothetical protein
MLIDCFLSVAYYDMRVLFVVGLCPLELIINWCNLDQLVDEVLSVDVVDCRGNER